MNAPQLPKIQFRYLKRAPYKVIDWVGSSASLVAHTLAFLGIFVFYYFGVGFDKILLVLTTAVSLEAIYLAIFIQMAVNRTTQSLQDVEEDIEEIQKDVGEIHENVEDLGEDVVSLQEDVEEISEDIDEISTEDLDDQTAEKRNNVVLSNIESQLQFLIKEVEILKNHKRGGVGQ